MKLGEIAVITGTQFVERTTIVNTNNTQEEKICIAEITDVEILFDGALTSAIGKGNTKAQARHDLVMRLRGATLIKNAYTPKRWQVTLPETISTKL